jgi:hypothetical protein
MRNGSAAFDVETTGLSPNRGQRIILVTHNKNGLLLGYQGNSMVKKSKRPGGNLDAHYDPVLGEISSVIEAARRSAARSVNCIMTAAYWLIGRRIVESEQGGKE